MCRFQKKNDTNRVLEKISSFIPRYYSYCLQFPLSYMCILQYSKQNIHVATLIMMVTRLCSNNISKQNCSGRSGGRFCQIDSSNGSLCNQFIPDIKMNTLNIKSCKSKLTINLWLVFIIQKCKVHKPPFQIGKLNPHKNVLL